MDYPHETSGLADSQPLEQHGVTMRLGLFFDGTGNNRINTQIAADCGAQLAANKNTHIPGCYGHHNNPDSSYANDFSNVARLYELYYQRPVAKETAHGWQVVKPIYISGVGTTSGKGDSVWAGLTLGRGSTGVLAKVASAIRKLERELLGFAASNPGCVIDALEFDLFGFSRGAAAARHFANEVLKQAKGALGPVLGQRHIPWASGFAWDNGSVRLKVIGLFDTVAAVGGLKDLGNVRDAHNPQINLYLPPGAAQQVLHLVAGDEQRRNFVLNSVAPDWPREIVLPGAHSDIGGGYHLQMREKVLLTRPRRSVVSNDTPCHASIAWKETQAELQAMDGSQWLDPLDLNASLRIECHERHPRAGSSKVGVKAVVAAVSMERRVYGHLSRVHLRVMHALACAEGVPLEPVPETAVLSLTPELQVIAQKLIAYALGGPYSLTEHEQRLLRRRYIHRSAHWNAAIGGKTSMSTALFVHAPQADGRARHPNRGQPGYPF
ncbi:T6SS phospholipase effector Tle1-like catalytic domain-containing protein [Pseudomonas sp. NA-150]|uniref:T6SS phospholipase effector Tle1-like catalytic domain-containing protein n=1 Tax=Pseudomonas sp. NA-150 TaxID=3367525 RepID=UPI0037CC7147